MAVADTCLPTLRQLAAPRSARTARYFAPAGRFLLTFAKSQPGNSFALHSNARELADYCMLHVQHCLELLTCSDDGIRTCSNCAAVICSVRS